MNPGASTQKSRQPAVTPSRLAPKIHGVNEGVYGPIAGVFDFMHSRTFQENPIAHSYIADARDNHAPRPGRP